MKSRKKVILNPTIARQLLQRGNPIIDIKANKNAPRETVFVFNDDDKLNDDIRDIVGITKEQ